MAGITTKLVWECLKEITKRSVVNMNNRFNENILLLLYLSKNENRKFEEL